MPRRAGGAGRLENFLEPPPALPSGPSVGVEQPEKALTSIGYVCNQYHLHAEAITCHRLALRYAPGLALAHWNLGMSLLMEDATWQAGWEEYEWRWHWPECPERPRHLPVPPWRGEDLHGKRLLVWTEQGYGDALQFVALLPRSGTGCRGSPGNHGPLTAPVPAKLPGCADHRTTGSSRSDPL
ncbi:hypothetical protein HF563_03545 [Acidithiobacillus ferridurans]|nr:hypothetical protein [Acidithiobacillus ferridurans]